MLIAAFEGWSDAGSATTTSLQHLGELISVELLHTIGSDGFVDYQVHRPKIGFDADGNRVLDWPETRLYGTVERPGQPPAFPDPTAQVHRLDGTPVSDIFLLTGVEPARDWVSYAEELADVCDSWGIDWVILLGSMFSDAPHSRPIVTSITSENAELRTSTGATRSDYEGPIGILSVIDLVLTEAEIPVLSLWAQVPHYVHSSPSPKVALALLDKLEELLDVVIPRGDLLSEATEWEANIDRIAGADDDMALYIRRLEEARDATNSPEATGDAIAYEFEKYLRIDTERPKGNDSRAAQTGDSGSDTHDGPELTGGSADSPGTTE